jgi:hypothetical protein
MLDDAIPVIKEADYGQFLGLHIWDLPGSYEGWIAMRAQARQQHPNAGETEISPQQFDEWFLRMNKSVPRHVEHLSQYAASKRWPSAPTFAAR